MYRTTVYHWSSNSLANSVRICINVLILHDNVSVFIIVMRCFSLRLHRRITLFALHFASVLPLFVSCHRILPQAWAKFTRKSLNYIRP